MHTSEFDYELPESAIAQEAIEPRDSSRLLRVADLSDHSFRELPSLLAPGDLVVVNRTRVRHARLEGTRVGTGGAVELLLLVTDGETWEALVRPARRMRPGIELEFGSIRGTVLTEPRDGRVRVRLDADYPIEVALESEGRVPLPPYFHGVLSDPERYQTVFAAAIGSAAAPTAALHFTPDLVELLNHRSVGIAEVELEVGLDTFRPMATGDLEDHEMHSEKFTVPEATVAAVVEAQQAGGRIVAVGTTVMRSLETAAEGGTLRPAQGASSLFIRPGFEPRVVDALITNFHAPRTTLVVLVAALLGDEWRNVYGTALERGYRFLSFGDAMLIEDLRTR